MSTRSRKINEAGIEAFNNQNETPNSGTGVIQRIRSAVAETAVGRALGLVVGFGTVGAAAAGCSSTGGSTSTVSVDGEHWYQDMHADMKTGGFWNSEAHLEVGDDCRLTARLSSGKNASYGGTVTEYKDGKEVADLEKMSGGFLSHQTSALKIGDYDLGASENGKHWWDTSYQTEGQVHMDVESEGGQTYKVTMYPTGGDPNTAVSKTCDANYTLGIGL